MNVAIKEYWNYIRLEGALQLSEPLRCSSNEYLVLFGRVI